MKNVLKFAVIGLLLLCIVAVPVFGVYFYSSPQLYAQSPDDYYVSPAITEDNALMTNRQFGGGTSVYLSIDSEKELTKDDYKKSAEILQNRFLAMGYTDAVASVEDNLIRLDISQKSYINSIIQQFGAIGEWSLVGSDMSTALCDGKLVSDAIPVANTSGSYSIRLTFTEDGAKKFVENTKSYALSSSYIYFMVDGQLVNFATISTSEVRETFTFGTFDYSSAIMYASMIKNGTIPGALNVERTEELAPSFSPAIITACKIGSVVVLALLAAVLIIKGKISGLFAVLVLIADVAVLLTANLNAAFTLHLASLIGILVLLAISAAISYFALHAIGKSAQDKSAIDANAMAQLGKYNLKVILVHAVLLTLSIIGRFFASGVLLSIAQAALVFTCANFIFYFVFLYFPVHTLFDMKKKN